MNKCPLDCTAIDRYMYDITGAILIYMFYIIAGSNQGSDCSVRLRKGQDFLKKTNSVLLVANYFHCGISSNGQTNFLSFVCMWNVNNIIMVLSFISKKSYFSIQKCCVIYPPHQLYLLIWEKKIRKCFCSSSVIVFLFIRTLFIDDASV